MATPKVPNNPDNYMIPSAISVWFAPFGADDVLDSYVDLGNIMNLALTLSDTYLEHMSARNGLSAPDKTVITSYTGQVKFTLDELVACNLILLYRSQTVPDAAATYSVLDQKRLRLTDTTAVVIDPLAVEDGGTDYLDLYWEDSSVSDVLVRSTDGTITYTEGVDYTFTQAAGTGTGRTPATIARIAGSGSAIDSGQEVLVTYQYDREATSYKIQEGAVLEGALKVQALNRIGPMFAWEFPFVSIKLDGDVNVNPEEYMAANFIAEILTDGQGDRGTFYLFDQFQKLVAASAC